MCGETIRPFIRQSPFLYSKWYNINSIFNIYCIGFYNLVNSNIMITIIIIIIIIIIIMIMMIKIILIIAVVVVIINRPFQLGDSFTGSTTT